MFTKTTIKWITLGMALVFLMSTLACALMGY